MKKFIYTNADGSLSLVVASKKESIENILGPLTDAEYEAHIVEKSVPSDRSNVQFINDDDIPQDKEFRNAWIQNGNKIDFDLEKARIIQLQRIREAREPKLRELDIDYMRLNESKQDTSEVVLKKQLLRDITEPLKNMQLNSIEDVKSAFPEELKSKLK
jgi:hypothetical protein